MWRRATNSASSRSTSVERLGGGGGSGRSSSPLGSAPVVHPTNSHSSAAAAGTSNSRKWPLRSIFFYTRGDSLGPSGVDSVRPYQLRKKSDAFNNDSDSAASPALQLSSSRLTVDKGLRRPHVSTASPPHHSGCMDVEDRGDDNEPGSLAAMFEQQTLPALPRAKGPPLAVEMQYIAGSDDVFVSDVALAHPRHCHAPQRAALEPTYTPPCVLPSGRTQQQQVGPSALATAAFDAATGTLNPAKGEHFEVAGHDELYQKAPLAALTPTPVAFHSSIAGSHGARKDSIIGAGLQRANPLLPKRRKKGLGAVAVLSSNIPPPDSSPAVDAALAADEAERRRLEAEEAERRRLEAEEAEPAAERRGCLYAVHALLELIARACECDVPVCTEVTGNAASLFATVTKTLHVVQQQAEKRSKEEAVFRTDSLDRDWDTVRNYGTVAHMLAEYTQTAGGREGDWLEVDRQRSQRSLQLLLETWQKISAALPGMWRQAWASAMANEASDKQLRGATSVTTVMQREPVTFAGQTAVELIAFLVQSRLPSGPPFRAREVHAKVVASLESTLRSSTVPAAAPVATTALTMSEMSPWIVEVVAEMAETMRRRDEMIKQRVADVASAAAAADDCGNVNRTVREARVELREGSWALWYVLRVVGLLAWWEAMLPHLFRCHPTSAPPHIEGGATDAFLSAALTRSGAGGDRRAEEDTRGRDREE